MSISHVVSLSAWCQASFQIKNHGLPLLPSCFDWLVTPWAGMMRILETDGEELGKNFTLNETAKSVQCSSYGVLYHHEFPHDEEDMPIISIESRDKMRSKLLYKHKRMHETLSNAGGEGVVFVRYGGVAEPAMAWPYLHDPAPVTEAHLNELMDFLKQKYPKINSRLLFLWLSPFATYSINMDTLHPDVHAVALPPPTAEKTAWTGEDGPWTDAFNSAFRRWAADMTAIPQGLDPATLLH